VLLEPFADLPQPLLKLFINYASQLEVGPRTNDATVLWRQLRALSWRAIGHSGAAAPKQGLLQGRC